MKGKASGYLMPPFVQPCARSRMHFTPELPVSPEHTRRTRRRRRTGCVENRRVARMDLDLGWTKEFGLRESGLCLSLSLAQWLLQITV